MPNQPPTTNAYPVLFATPLPLETAWQLYALAYIHGVSKNATVRAVIDAGLTALSSTHKENTNAEESEADQG